VAAFTKTSIIPIQSSGKPKWFPALDLCEFEFLRAVNTELGRISRVRCHLPLAKYMKLH
jgi:hypothetical protein